MRYVRFKDGTQCGDYLQVHETINGFACFICRDDRYERTALTREHAEDLQLSLPKGYKIIYQRREDADEQMRRIARLNGFYKSE